MDLSVDVKCTLHKMSDERVVSRALIKYPQSPWSSMDTTHYVENQVQTVGESVKFCSEMMHDLHPVSVAAANFYVNPYAHLEIEKKVYGKKENCTRIRCEYHRR